MEEYFSVYPAVEEDTSPDIPDGTCSNSTKSVICIQLYKEATSHYLKMAMLPIHPRQFQLMGLMVQQQEEDNAVLLVLLHQRRRRRRQRRYWLRLWIARRLECGHYHNLMVELEWEHCGDYKLSADGPIYVS